MPQPLEKEHYTYADYLEWDTKERYELIYGELVMMPSPTFTHQEIVGEIYTQLRIFLKGKPCKVTVAPFDVRLFEKEGDKPNNVNTIVQPDIFVVCDRKKIDEHGIKGAPDLAIEILSPSTASNDCFVKFNLYLQAGVREYWIVDPDSQSIHVYLLENDKFQLSQTYSRNDIAKVNILNGCAIDLSKVFPEN